MQTQKRSLIERVKPTRLAAVSIAIVGAYLQLVEWVDLFPWNDVRNGNGQETLDLILLGATVAIVVSLWFRGRIAAMAASCALAAWMYLQIATWWIPYVRGASPGWKRIYERWFSETIQVLPRTEDSLPPDANHLVLQLLILTALLTSLRAASTKKQRKE